MIQCMAMRNVLIIEVNNYKGVDYFSSNGTC